MSLGQLQSRPVTEFTAFVDTLTGKVATFGAVVDNTDGVLVDGTHTNAGLGYATTTDGGGTGCKVNVVIAGGNVTGIVLFAAGTGYAPGDTIVVAEDADFSTLATGTIDSTVATITGEVATVTLAGGTGGAGFVAGDVISAGEISTDGSGTGLALEVDTVGALGVVTAFIISAGGTGYAAGDTIAYAGAGEIGVPSAAYYDHNQYESGGVVTEYLVYPNGALDDGYPSSYTPTGVLGAKQVLIKTVRKPDLPQLKVPRWEPTIVDGNGVKVGNTLRAEDITDEDRCTAAGFTWVEANTNQGLGKYGYCQYPAAVFAATMGQAECIGSGFLYDQYLDVCVNTTGDQVATVEAYLNGGAGDLYDDKIKNSMCKAQGFFWNGTACVTFVAANHAQYVTQSTCSANGGIWIAGVCYSPEDFGNGQGGDFSTQSGSHNL